SLEEAIDIVGAGQVAPVDRQQVLAGGDVDARLRERRDRLRVPILAVVNTSETIAAVLDLVVASEQPGLNAFDLRLLAAEDAQVTDDEVAEHFGEEIVQIRARADAVDKFRVPLFGPWQIETVEAGIVE